MLFSNYVIRRITNVITKNDYFYIIYSMGSHFEMFSIEDNDHFEDLKGFNEQLSGGFDLTRSFYGFNKLHHELFMKFREISDDVYSEMDLCDKARKAGDDVYNEIRKKADEFLTRVEKFRVERPDVMNYKNRSSLAINQMYIDVLSRGIFSFTPERFAIRSQIFGAINASEDVHEEEEQEFQDEYPNNWWEREEAKGHFNDYSDDSELEQMF